MGLVVCGRLSPHPRPLSHCAGSPFDRLRVSGSGRGAAGRVEACASAVVFGSSPAHPSGLRPDTPPAAGCVPASGSGGAVHTSMGWRVRRLGPHPGPRAVRCTSVGRWWGASRLGSGGASPRSASTASICSFVLLFFRRFPIWTVVKLSAPTMGIMARSRRAGVVGGGGAPPGDGAHAVVDAAQTSKGGGASVARGVRAGQRCDLGADGGGHGAAEEAAEVGGQHAEVDGEAGGGVCAVFEGVEVALRCASTAGCGLGGCGVGHLGASHGR
jgi:hypothetical protein